MVSFVHAEVVPSSSASARVDSVPASTAPIRAEDASMSTGAERAAEAVPATMEPAHLQEDSVSTGPAKVIATFLDRNTTKLVIESRQPLIPGRNVYVGPNFVAVTMGDLLSRKEDLFYYAASTPGRPKIQSGDEVSLEPPRTLHPPSIFSVVLKEHYNFEQKFRGEITAVQGDRALIDRGSLNEVRERDLYKVYDANGRYKGMLEIRGPGDLQSSGKLYNAIEDWHRDALKTRPGDRVEFVGQRKLFGLGFLGGQTFKGETVLNGKETIFGGGLLWDVTLLDGWGGEVVFGAFVRDGSGTNNQMVSVQIPPPFPPGFFRNVPSYEYDQHKAYYIAPIWLKKNFFYPSVISPFLGVGPALFFGLNKYSKYQSDVTNSTTIAIADAEKRKVALVPALGAGIEFFPGRFFRPRMEVRYFPGPKLVAGGNTFYTESVFYSLGFATTW